jgi:hypothetical protein
LTFWAWAYSGLGAYLVKSGSGFCSISIKVRPAGPSPKTQALGPEPDPGLIKTRLKESLFLSDGRRALRQVEPVQGQQLVEVLLVRNRRWVVEQLEVPVLVADSCLESML